MHVMYPGSWLMPRKYESVTPHYLAIEQVGSCFRVWHLPADGSEPQLVSGTEVEPAEIFRELGAACVGVPGPHYLVDWDAYDTLCGLGLGEAIDRGEVRVSVSGPGDPENRPHELHGAFVCESPPTILDVLLLPTKTKLRVIDARNYGFDALEYRNRHPDRHLAVLEAMRAWRRFADATQLRTAAPTSASAGYGLWRRNLQRARVYAHTHEPARRLEREANVGGRNECYRLGALPGRWYYLDCRAMYSWIAKNCRHPVLLVDYWEGSGAVGMRATVTGHHCIADVLVRTDEARYPCRHGGRVVYPTGTFRTVLQGPELEHAADTGRVLRVYRRAVYELGDPFAAWSPYGILAAGKSLSGENLGIYGVAKTVVNATYGRICSGGREWRHLPGVEARRRWDRSLCLSPLDGFAAKCRTIDWLVQWLDEAGEPPDSVPSISSSIASWGRHIISTLMRRVPLGHIAYVDTDGVIGDQTAYDLLMLEYPGDGGVLPALGIKDESDDVEIFGCKHFRFGKRYTCAGVPLHKAVMELDGLVWQESVRLPLQLSQGKAFVRESAQRRRQSAIQYQHGTVRPNGLVDPLVLGYDDESEDNFDRRPIK